MSKERYSYEEFNNAYGIRDNEKDILLNVPLVVNMLNENYKKISELQDQLALTEKALDLMSLVLCTGARNDLKSQLGKFTLRESVKKFFLEQAQKEIKDEV